MKFLGSIQKCGKNAIFVVLEGPYFLVVPGQHIYLTTQFGCPFWPMDHLIQLYKCYIIVPRTLNGISTNFYLL